MIDDGDEDGELGISGGGVCVSGFWVEEQRRQTRCEREKEGEGVYFEAGTGLGSGVSELSFFSLNRFTQFLGQFNVVLDRFLTILPGSTILDIFPTFLPCLATYSKLFKTCKIK